MNLDLAELHKIYVTNKYNFTTIVLNPFSELLFTENWIWPEQFISQKKTTIKKTITYGDPLKQKIKDWFQNLNLQQKINCLSIQDKHFIQSFRFFYSTYKPSMIYNMKSRKSMTNPENSGGNPLQQKGFDSIVKNLQIALLSEPILYLNKNIQNFLNNELIKWMQIITSNKIFQYASKQKQQQNPLQNPLWFSYHSFHNLQSILINQFQKSIIRCYFDRNKLRLTYLSDLKDFCKSNYQSTQLKNIQTNLNYSFVNSLGEDNDQLKQKVQEIRKVEEGYQKQKENIIYNMIENLQNQQVNSKKKKRIRKKGKKIIDQINKIQETQTNLNQIQQINQKLVQIQQIKGLKDINKQQKQEIKNQQLQLHQTDVTISHYFENDSFEQKIIISENFVLDDLLSHTTQQNKLQIDQIVHINSLDSNEHLMKQKSKKRSRKQKQIQNFHQNITNSIRKNAFTQFIDTISIQSNNLYSSKLNAYQYICFFISCLFPPTTLTLFGSNAVGLSLASSDIDIMISHPRWSCIQQIRQVLFHIGQEIGKMGWVVDFRLILNAKVPLLKVYVDPRGQYFQLSTLKFAQNTVLNDALVIKCDIIINVDGQGNIGGESTALMRQYLSTYPQLQRIILFFKYVLWYYGLNENYTGGICSYCLFLMIGNCLFNNQMQNDQFNLNDDDQGTYIIEILKFYTQKFDPKTDQISIIKPKQQKRQQSPLPRRVLNLKVVDPINGQYIQSSFSKFPQIQQLFSMLLVQTMKNDTKIYHYISNHQQIDQQYKRLQNSTNIITKDYNFEGKVKKIVKKVLAKIQKFQDFTYNVKEVVGVGFRIGVEKWMNRDKNYIY